MTTDELRAAAGSYAGRLYRERVADPVYRDHKFFGIDVIEAFVSGAAWRPADDADFPDPEWLRSMGGEPDDEAEPGSGNEPPWLFTYPDLNVALTLTRRSDCWTAELGGGDFSSGNWPHDIRTRDQVRQLLAALGIH